VTKKVRLHGHKGGRLRGTSIPEEGRKVGKGRKRRRKTWK
jgi:hypothetical protein